MDGGLPDGMFLSCRRRSCRRRWRTWALFAAQQERHGTADFCVASASYFRALGIPLIRGRLFDDRDGLTGPVAVISESLARTGGQTWIRSAARSNSATWTATYGCLRSSASWATRASTASSSRRVRRCTSNLAQRPRFETTVVIRSTADLARHHDRRARCPARPGRPTCRRASGRSRISTRRRSARGIST